MESGFTRTPQEQALKASSSMLSPFEESSGSATATASFGAKVADPKFSTVPAVGVLKHGAPYPPPPPPPPPPSSSHSNGLGVINHNYQDDNGVGDGQVMGIGGTALQHQHLPSSGSSGGVDAQVALIGRDCVNQSVLNYDQLAAALPPSVLANRIESHTTSDQPSSVVHSPVDHRSIDTTLVHDPLATTDQTLLLVDLNTPVPINDHPYHHLNRANMLDENDQEPRHPFDSSLEPSPEPELEPGAKKKATTTLNPVGPLEFVERYRNRNSSQRPLVGGDSFSSSNSSSTKSPFGGGDSASTVELNKDSSTCSGTADMSCTVSTAEEEVIEDDDRDGDLDSMPERGQWSGKLDFIFSCISYAVGLGNVWRFPYLCYENGGGAFLIPYLICVAVLGIPLFLMEVGLGQYLQQGGVGVWNKIPILKGIGFASMVMIGLCNTYYIVIISWTLYYLFNSFKNPLPWSLCGQWWNTPSCHEPDGSANETIGAVPPSQEFWNNNVLGITGDLAEVSGMQWHLFITLIIAWILVYGVIYKGIHQSGKIIWFTAMFPYVILVILFGYGVSLEGAGNGISFYLTPKWHMLGEAKIWVAAGTQLLFTYGIGIGTNIALGSYNTYNHNFLRDSLIACLLSSGTSLFSGFVIFSVLGHLAFTLNTTVEEVAQGGPGLTFIVYPEAVTRLPVSQLWAVLFFIMLLVLGIDSQFCTVESFVTGMVDEWPRFLRPRRRLFTATVILIHFVLGLTMITNGGMYVFQLMDNFSASGISLMIVVLSEIIGFAWIYGGNNMYHNMCKMLGYRPSRILYYLWVFVSPTILAAILIFSIVQYHPPEYAGQQFPWYGQLIGWLISSASIICIPTYVLYYLFYKSDQSLSLKERFLNGLSDSSNGESVSTTDNASTLTDMEKASNRDLLDHQSHLSDHYHHAHLDTNGVDHHHHHHHHPHHMILSKPYMLGGSNSTLSTSIADQSFNSSVQHINNQN